MRLGRRHGLLGRWRLGATGCYRAVVDAALTLLVERRAIVGVGAQFWINGMVYAAIIPRLPDIRDRLDVSVAALGTILTLSAIGGLLGSAVAGPMISRFGTRRCIIVGTFITVGLLPLIGVTRSPVVLVLVMGAVWALDVTIDIAMNLQGSWLSARRPIPIMNRLHGLWSLGTVIGGLIAVQAAGAGVSLLSHLLIVAIVLGVVVAVLGRSLLPGKLEEPTAATSVDDGLTSPSATETASNGAGRIGLLLMALGAAAVTMEITTSDWAAFRLADDLGAGPGLVGLGFVAFTSGMVVGRMSGDAIQTRIGEHALIRSTAGLAIVGLTLATLVPFGRLFGVDPAAPVALGATVVGYFIAALGASVVFPQLYDAAAKAPGRPGAGLAALTAGTRVAGVLAPIIVGVLADTALSVGAAVALLTIPASAVILFAGTRAESGDRPAVASSHGTSG